MTNIAKDLFALRDPKFAEGQKNIIPTVDPSRLIGVRTPALRDYAKKMYREGEFEDFLNDLPHEYFDEDQVHAFVISLEKDFNKCMVEVERFLPFIDNWATCDQLSPKAFRKEPERLLSYIPKWIGSGETYTIRFGVKCLMEYFLGDRFSTGYADMVAGIQSDEYYVNMMRAWYFATALAKNYDEVLPYIESKKLDDWTHNKAIQKSIESYRITDEQKAYLRTLKVGRNRR